MEAVLLVREGTRTASQYGYEISQELTMAIDPVCDMQLDENNATITSEYKNRKFYFCSEECKEVFETNPEPYAQKVA